MKQKIISIILTLSLFSAVIPVLAEDKDHTEIKSDETIQELAPTPIPQNDVYYEVDEETEQDDVEIEPIVHTETINSDIEFTDEEYNLMQPDFPEPGISMFSTTETTAADMWEDVFTLQFGDDYLKPYEKKQDGQRITGNTNRLIAEETDLSLPGKNGLDLVLKRRHDNQDYNKIYSKVCGDVEAAGIPTYIYSFKNTANNSKIKVAFYFEDDFYTYMANGCYLKELDSRNLDEYTEDKVTYYFYPYSYINTRITDEENGIFYEYDDSIEPVELDRYYNNSGSYYLSSVRLLSDRNNIGNRWKLLLPEVYLSRYSLEMGKEHVGQRREYKYYQSEYVGAFRDLDGNVYQIKGNDTYKRYDDKSLGIEYTSQYSCSENGYLSFEGLYTPKELFTGGPMYHFTVKDSRGLTYYLYDTSLKPTKNPPSKHTMIIIAVEDDYGNMIRYEYDDDFVNLTKIIDTYGREINFNWTEGCNTVSYYDDIAGETKTIKYETSTLPSTALDNDSTIKHKEVQRFTVTNQYGEKTMYDSRETRVINTLTSSGNVNTYPDGGERDVAWANNSNIERIIYPTGAETRYRYNYIFPRSEGVARGVYGVDAVYDIVDGQEVNRKEYSFSGSKAITVTETDSVSNKRNVKTYSEGALLTEDKTMPMTASYPCHQTTYTYQGHRPKKISEKTSTTNKTIEYEYGLVFPDRIKSETIDKKKILYTYHDISNTERTDKIATATYQYKDSKGKYVTDFTVSTELTEDKKEIACERIVKDNIVQSQVKYGYDSEGNVISTKQWTSDTNGDGVLDDNDEYITTQSTYTNTAQKSKNIKNTVPNITNADGTNEGSVTAEYKLNIYGSPTYQKDSYGTETTIEYDALNRPVKYHLPNGGTQTVEYVIDQANKNSYTIFTDAEGAKQKNVYDGIGRITEKYKWSGKSWLPLEKYTYDASGRLAVKTAVQDGADMVKEKYTYDEIDRLIKKEVLNKNNQLYRTETYTYASMAVTKTTSDSYGSEIADEKTTYDGLGRVIKTEAMSGKESLLASTCEYDYLDRKIKETDPNGNSTAYEYDCKGQLVKQTNAVGHSVSAQYDLAGRKISETDLNGNTTLTDYDQLGRAVKVTAPFDTNGNAVTKTYYDKNSNIIKTAVRTDGNNYQTEEYKYDKMGNLLGTISGKNAEQSVVQYSYDKANRVTKMTTGLTAYSESPTGGAVTSYQYNTDGTLAKLTDPMGNVERYSYYDNGNLKETIEKNGGDVYYTYSIFGVTQVIGADGISGSAINETVYNGLGQVIKTKGRNQNGETAEESYTYDLLGRVSSKTSPDGTVQNYTYDNNSNILSYDMVKDNETKNSITYEYNALNQLTSLTNNGIITSYQYDNNGNLTKKLLNNGQTTDYTYNNGGLLSNTTSKKGSKVQTYSECQYMFNGLMTSVKMPCDDESNTMEQKFKSFQYDSLGRLKNEYVSQGAGGVLNSAYTYDTFGNRIKQVDTDGDNYITNTTNYQYDLNNRLIQSSTEYYDEGKDIRKNTAKRYYYDENGNTIAEQEKTYTDGRESSNMSISGRIGGSSLKVYKYDAFNRLIQYNDSVSEATYTYGANNLRASKTVNGAETDFVWNGQNLAGEFQNDTVNTYTYDVTGVHMANQNGTVASYIKDYHGNIVAKANTSGNMIDEMIDRRDYDAFGNHRNGAEADPFGYCGEYLDSESGLIYLRNRYYQAETGRFITEDPVKDGLNWYSYCAGNPVMFIDPSGFLREGYYDEYGNYHDDPDAEEFGEDSLVYSSLVTLGDMWQARPGDRGTIADLAERVREAGRVSGFKRKLKLAMQYAGSSANDTDIVLAAGNLSDAYEANELKNKAEELADYYYGTDADGTAHNAFKHAYWSALMTYCISEDYAKQVGFAHEFGAKENLNQDDLQQSLFNMDLYNNSVGRDIAKQYKQNLSWWDSMTHNIKNDLAEIVVNNINQGILVIVR